MVKSILKSKKAMIINQDKLIQYALANNTRLLESFPE